VTGKFKEIKGVGFQELIESYLDISYKS
jgi:hypothetical protein